MSGINCDAFYVRQSQSFLSYLPVPITCDKRAVHFTSLHSHGLPVVVAYTEAALRLLHQALAVDQRNDDALTLQLPGDGMRWYVVVTGEQDERDEMSEREG